MQECKISNVFKRFAISRNQNLKKIIFDKKKEDAHWIIICKTIIYLSLFQIKDKITVQIMEYVKQQLKNNVLVKFSL